MNYIICKIINAIPIPLSMDRIPESSVDEHLSRLKAAEPNEEFVALAVR